MTDYKDKRASERFSINAQSSCDFASPVLEDFGPVKVKNVSTDGIGFITSERVGPGLLLASFLHFLTVSPFCISFLLLLPAIEQHASRMAAYACKISFSTFVLLSWPHQGMMLWSLSSLILFP